MMADYTKWPVVSDVAERLNSRGITLRTPSRIAPVLASIIRQVATVTRRQFVAGAAGEIRYYDGSGTVELELPEEIIVLVSVQILGYIGITGGLYPVTSPYLIQEQDLPRTRILLYQGTAPVYAGIYLSRFPQGHRNIQVVGTFGYDVTIPADLWEAVADLAAARLTNEARSSQRGVVVDKREGDVQTKWDATGNLQDAQREFRRCLTLYTRPMGYSLRHQKAPMT
jgi:hypothetical protein